MTTEAWQLNLPNWTIKCDFTVCNWFFERKTSLDDDAKSETLLLVKCAHFPCFHGNAWKFAHFDRNARISTHFERPLPAWIIFWFYKFYPHLVALFSWDYFAGFIFLTLTEGNSFWKKISLVTFHIRCYYAVS